MPNIVPTIAEILPFADLSHEGYSGWALRPFADAADLAALLRRIAADLDAGIAQPLGTSGHVVHFYLGTDTDGTRDVNLDTGHRSVALGLRYGRVEPTATTTTDR